MRQNRTNGDPLDLVSWSHVLSWQTKSVSVPTELRDGKWALASGANVTASTSWGGRVSSDQGSGCNIDVTGWVQKDLSGMIGTISIACGVLREDNPNEEEGEGVTGLSSGNGAWNLNKKRDFIESDKQEELMIKLQVLRPITLRVEQSKESFSKCQWQSYQNLDCTRSSTCSKTTQEPGLTPMMISFHQKKNLSHHNPNSENQWHDV